MRRGLFMVAVIGLGLANVVFAADTTPSDLELEAAVREVLRQVPLIDGHNDAPWAIRSRVSNHLDGFDFRDTADIEDPMHTDIARLRAGGVGVIRTSLHDPYASKPSRLRIGLPVCPQLEP